MFNSLLLGGPQTLYRFHHLHHHKYNNDAPDPETGTTKDLSSTWRFSRRPERRGELPVLCPAGLLPLRLRLPPSRGEEAASDARAGDLARQWPCSSWLVVLGMLNPLGLACFYLPVWYLGNAAAQAENYLEHHGAVPGNRKTDSVSSYGRLYNLIWFNNGYHQEHHYRPQVHWTRIPEVKDAAPSRVGSAAWCAGPTGSTSDPRRGRQAPVVACGGNHRRIISVILT